MTFAKFNWVPALFIIGYHLFLLVALPIYFLHFTPSWGLIALTVALVYITGIAVTAGYHRLYSHTTYKVNRIVEGIMLFFATMATQGSALRWAFHHRHHHAYVDTDRDPYSIKKGFWYAHFLWLLEKPIDIEKKVVADLIKNPMIRFQHRFYGALMVITNAIVFLFIGWCSGDYLGAFLFTWIVRMFFLHHFTWFINSLAHTWGARTFCQELSAVDNYAISLVTFGEGYHNYHHTFAYDYRNGIRWYHFDPTKWLIWTLSKIGLADKLKKNQHYFIERKLIFDRKQLLLEKIQSVSANKETWEKKLSILSESILVKLKEASQFSEQYQRLKKKKESPKELLRELHLQIKMKKNALKTEYRDWMFFSRQVMQLPALSQPSNHHITQAIPAEEC